MPLALIHFLEEPAFPAHPIQPVPPGGGVGIWPGPHPEHPWIPPSGAPPNVGIWPGPGFPTHPIAPGGQPPSVGTPGFPTHPITLPPGTSVPPDAIWPSPTPPDKPVTIPDGKVGIAIWVSGYGWKFTIVDTPPGMDTKPPETPPAQPKK